MIGTGYSMIMISWLYDFTGYLMISCKFISRLMSGGSVNHLINVHKGSELIYEKTITIFIFACNNTFYEMYCTIIYL